MASERIVRSGTAELFARIDGEDGPWVVLLNSLAADPSMWEPQVAALAAHYRVVRFDTRGHGRSSAPPPPYSIDALADDLFAVLAACNAAPAHVVGLSLGGVVAAAAALREPNAFASLAICDSRVAMPAEFRQGIDDRNRLVREQGMEAVVDLFIERWFTPAAPAAVREPVKGMIRGTSVAGFTGCSEALKHAAVLERLPEIRLPALFLVGTEDAAVPEPVMRDQQRRIANSRYAAIPRAGHLSNLEQPAAFNDALLAFLRSAA
ncbi:MAG TPA: alpha/beta fold hydrolase [Stellaceae bacterium]|nr:alpha/beta fold hydrolase [Stellaceae bacterium]